MNPTAPLHEDTVNNLPPETPHQVVQRCTRNSPCRLLGCTICPTPTNHVRNLGEELGTDDTNPTLPTTSDLPPPPPNHPILILSNPFKITIRKNRIYALKSLSKQFIHQLDTNLEFFAYDHSDLATYYQTAEDIINAHNTVTADPHPFPAQPTTSC